MANDIVINGETYPGAESLVLYDTDGNPVQFYSSAVLYTPQELTEEQKTQARENIGAVNESDVFDFETVPGSSNLINPAVWIENTSHAYQNGAYTVFEKQNYALYDFIPVEYGKTYVACGYLNGAIQLKFVRDTHLFDKDKNFIAIQAFTDGLATIDRENVRYIRFTTAQTYTRDLYFGEGNTVPATFIPYKEPSVKAVVSKSKLPDIEPAKLTPFEPAKNLYDFKKRIVGHTLSNGDLSANADYDASDFIAVEQEAVYSVAVWWQARAEWYYGAVTSVHCFDAEKVFLSTVTPANGVLTTPANCAFVRLRIAVAAVSEFALSALLTKGDTLPQNYVPYYSEYRIEDSYVGELWKHHNGWKHKKFVSYGDSITDQGFWQTYVSSYFDLIHLKRGVGGSGFVRGVSSWWANADGSYNSSYQTDEEAPEGATLCEACLCSDERINLSIPEDTDLVLIAGGTNDHGGDATNAPELGEISYEIVDGEPVFDTTTFKNAVCATVYKIMKRCPEAIVMLVTPVNTRGIDQVQTVNGRGLELLDYVHAIKECAEYMSVPCIDVYGESGLNQFNMAFNGNNLHPDDAGHRKMARAVIAKLKAYEPCDYPFVVE